MSNPSFEGHPVIVTEDRLLDLINKEAYLAVVIEYNPELEQGPISNPKLTPALKKNKKAFADFVARVEAVLGSEEFKGIFQVAAIHGCEYKGESLAKDILAAKSLLGLK